jgi:hypothetical protein
VSTELIASPDQLTADWKMANKLALSAFMPNSYRVQGMTLEQQVANAYAAILTGRELGIGPMSALRHIAIVKGKPTLSAALQLSLMRGAGVRVEVLESTGQVCRLRGSSEEAGTIEVSFGIEDAKTAGIYKQDSAWETYPEDMCWARAITRLARRIAPESTLAMYSPADFNERDVAEVRSNEIREPEPIRVGDADLRELPAADPPVLAGADGAAEGQAAAGPLPEVPAAPVAVAEPPEPYVDEIRRLVKLLGSDTTREVFTGRAAWSQLVGLVTDRKTGLKGWAVKLGKLHDAGEAVQVEIISALTERLP